MAYPETEISVLSVNGGENKNKQKCVIGRLESLIFYSEGTANRKNLRQIKNKTKLSKKAVREC